MDVVTYALCKGQGGGGSGGGVLVVGMNMQTSTLDKTWQEIADADYAVLKIEAEEGSTILQLLTGVWYGDGEYGADFAGIGNYSETRVNTVATSASGYPIATQ